jgi:hypothetical protein
VHKQYNTHSIFPTNMGILLPGDQQRGQHLIDTQILHNNNLKIYINGFHNSTVYQKLVQFRST